MPRPLCLEVSQYRCCCFSIVSWLYPRCLSFLSHQACRWFLTLISYRKEEFLDNEEDKYEAFFSSFAALSINYVINHIQKGKVFSHVICIPAAARSFISLNLLRVWIVCWRHWMHGHFLMLFIADSKTDQTCISMGHQWFTYANIIRDIL